MAEGNVGYRGLS